MNESTTKEETSSLEMEKPKAKLFDYKNYSIYRLLAYPFAIYFKQFFKYFLVALIPELIFFGIFRLVRLDITFNIVLGVFSADLDFASDAAAASFFILLLLAAFIFIFRSGLIATITWRSSQKGRANPFWAIEATFKQTTKFLLATIMMVFFLALPLMVIILSFIFSGNPILKGLTWTLMAIGVGLPLLFGSRICLFSTGITKDYFAAGTSFQKSWEFTKGKLWFRTLILLFVFVSLGFIGPLIVTNVLEGIYGFWAGFGMIFGRAFFYPLLDISLTLSYLNAEHLALDKAVFKEDIKRQQLLSEKFAESKKYRNL